MNHRPRILADAVRAGAFSWRLACRAFATEGRFQVFKPHLVAALAASPLAFLPETGDPEFREYPTGFRRRRADGSLGPYWTDLARLRPTTRQEEAVLSRAIELLRATLLQILGPEPPAAALAIAQEHLSPYSSVLESIRTEKVQARPVALDVAVRDILQQRLGELRTIQSALLDRNLHLVPAIARRYAHVGVPFEDLVQEGSSALLRAVERYNRHEGTRFARYANWWVQQGILKALSFQSRAVRLPVYLAQALHRVREVQARHPGPLDISSLAAETRLRPERAQRALDADRVCFSLDRGADDDDEGRMRDQIPDLRSRPQAEPDTPAPGELRAALEAWLDRLPAREALVLRLRYGLDDGRSWTLEKVGHRLGISRERVRQLHAPALRRLSRPTPRREFARFD